jgi:hypothetical protein
MYGGTPFHSNRFAIARPIVTAGLGLHASRVHQSRDSKGQAASVDEATR